LLILAVENLKSALEEFKAIQEELEETKLD
jgi:hypothetical protein